MADDLLRDERIHIRIYHIGYQRRSKHVMVIVAALLGCAYESALSRTEYITNQRISALAVLLFEVTGDQHFDQRLTRDTQPSGFLVE